MNHTNKTLPSHRALLHGCPSMNVIDSRFACFDQRSSFHKIPCTLATSGSVYNCKLVQTRASTPSTQQKQAREAKKPAAAVSKDPFVMVTSTTQAKSIYGIAESTGRVALDCEGCSLSRAGQLCLVQMKAGKKCYLFDVLYANTGVMQQLQAILEDSNVVKVMQDCRNDSAALMYQKGIEIRNIFDLQVADGLIELWKGASGLQCCKEKIGLQKLLAKYKMPLSASKTGMPKKMWRNPTLWKKRPLSQDLVKYAVEDVSHLLSLADKLTAELGTSQLQLLAKLSQNYSQTFWLPADRTKSRDLLEVAGLFGLYMYFTQSSSGSWLAPLLDRGEFDLQ